MQSLSVFLILPLRVNNHPKNNSSLFTLHWKLITIHFSLITFN